MTNKAAFSLVELSIVLVILGLLTGGILTAQNLIRAAELKSVITEKEKFQTAAMTFRDRYFYLPGDMPNATLFWGQATNCTGSATALAAGTCNAYEANGYIGRPPNDTNWQHDREFFYAWHHLSLAGLIEGDYWGLSNFPGSSMGAVSGKNVPVSKLGNAHWCFTSRSGPRWGHPDDYSNSLTLASHPGNLANDRNCNCHNGSVPAHLPDWLQPLTPTEAWGIDKKIDDGMPNQGSVRAPDTYPGACTDTILYDGPSGSPTTAIPVNAAAGYLLTQENPWCRMVFINLF